jgi:hypothetical protein
MIDPKEDLINYYGNVVVEAQHRMVEERNFNELTYDDEEEQDDEYDELAEDELFEILREKKNSKLH